jgi:hypothetical protein
MVLSNTNDLLEADAQQLNSKINLALSETDLALRYYLATCEWNLIKSLNINQNTKMKSNNPKNKKIYIHFLTLL